MAPRVLISDKLSPAAVDIFRERGVDVDFKPELGADKEALAHVIGDYRRPRRPLGHQGHREGDRRAPNGSRSIGRAGIGVDNVDIPAATAAGHHRDEHALRQLDHHRRARHRHDVRLRPPDPRRRPVDPGRQVGEEPLHGRRDHRQDAGRHRLRQHRRHRRRPGAGPEDEGHRLRSVPVGRSAPSSIGVEKVELDELLARADFITLHTPLTDKTRNILSPRGARQDEARACGSSTARAAGWSTRRRLRDGARRTATSAGAAFDVFAEEPATDNVLFGAPNIVCTPHLGASTTEAQENVALQVAEQMADYLLDRRGHQRAQHAVDHRRGGAAPEAVRAARRAARLLRRPADRERRAARSARIRGRGRGDERQAR